MPSTTPFLSARRILVAGAVAGALDLLFAFCLSAAVRGSFAVDKVLVSIASGIYGPAAQEGGARVLVAGVVLHFLIATVWAALFAAAMTWAAPVRALAARLGPLATGALYGVTVWAGMRFVVVPLSHAASGPLKLTWVLPVMIAGHVLFVGIPIVGIVGRGVGTDARGVRRRPATA